MEPHTMGNGSKINSMALEQKLGLTEPNTREITSKEKKKAWGNFSGLTELLTMENSKIIISRGKESIFGLIKGNIMEIG
jgi:hypothetical protein